ncbi:helix-turn-helix domain-containing protein [Legionella israelensis]|uniref:Putative transcriptional regulator n=1 Tax=Legionella israelensis TaxID=454 RepID=A0A0W0V291_9GAMM|nr:helix-turn-helix transcriptional regulator [Legionella israelensis]KTD14241.1 putative transcriptional regulator [Legionella israelensis]QBS10078.1 XRE family transcriptional regulator [Legionella israelensis]SCX97366.1 Helix-turn-helix [Legionella israelensis DSM 19235]STX59663.1 putative transcriptional regulator [Legionella israelensis]
MEKLDLTKQFAHRLKDAMIKAGFNSHRSTSGVSIHKLAEITGYSLQICRKYLRGEVIPEPMKLVDIAAKLNVSAGWLLFGDDDHEHHGLEKKITINQGLLHYIFTKAAHLYHHSSLDEDVPDFLTDLTNDVSQIHADEEQLKKIIDLALSSVKHFNPDKRALPKKNL